MTHVVTFAPIATELADAVTVRIALTMRIETLRAWRPPAASRRCDVRLRLPIPRATDIPGESELSFEPEAERWDGLS